MKKKKHTPSRKEIYIEYDLYEYFKEMAKNYGYPTQLYINQILRSVKDTWEQERKDTLK